MGGYCYTFLGRLLFPGREGVHAAGKRRAAGKREGNGTRVVRGQPAGTLSRTDNLFVAVTAFVTSRHAPSFLQCAFV